MSIALGANIKAIRESKSVSQQELAKRLKYLNQPQISKIEKGDRKATAQDLIEIATALNVSLDDLVKGKEQEVI